MVVCIIFELDWFSQCKLYCILFRCKTRLIKYTGCSQGKRGSKGQLDKVVMGHPFQVEGMIPNLETLIRCHLKNALRMLFVMFWALQMNVQMEFVMKGDFETNALYFRIILWGFSIF